MAEEQCVFLPLHFFIQQDHVCGEKKRKKKQNAANLKCETKLHTVIKACDRDRV